MAGLVVFIICVILAVLTFRKVSNYSRNKGRGKFRTSIAALVMSFIVFVVSVGIGSGVVSQDKSTDINAKASTTGSTETKKPMFINAISLMR
jgi:sensor histidine kinase regulating citrate/malate metabolism